MLGFTIDYHVKMWHISSVTPPKVTWDVSIGTMIHLVVLLLGLGTIYGTFASKLQAVEEMERQTTRIEHYLSSQDVDYWKKVALNGDSR